MLGCDGNQELPQSASIRTTPIVRESIFQEWHGFSQIARKHASNESSFEMPGIMGSGCSMIDLNSDERLDLVLVAGDPNETNANPTGALCQVLVQTPGGSFIDASAAAGIAVRGFGMGAFGGDIDNDGDTDVLTTSAAGNALYRNEGSMKFQDITSDAGIESSRWSTAAVFFDFDCDGWLDLLVVNYVDYFPGSLCLDGSGRRDYCGPQSFTGTSDRLFRNRGAEGKPGTFDDVTVSSGIARGLGKGLGAVCSDFNGDNRPDIYVANDMEPNFLWIQNDRGGFEEEAPIRGCSVDLQGRPQASMGTAWSDLDGDGLQDFFLTHLRGETNTMYRQLPNGVYLDQTALTNLGESSLNSTGFGVVVRDLNLDGHVDLAIANGHVMRSPLLRPTAAASHWAEYVDRNLLYLGTGEGVFKELSVDSDPFLVHHEVSRGLAAGDVDNDGDIDLLVSSVAAAPRLFRNESAGTGHWLTLSLRHPEWNRDAIGARVTLSAGDNRWTSEVMPNVGYLSSHDSRVHFGLGSIAAFDSIVVQWPVSPPYWEEFGPGPANQHLVLKKGSGKAVRDQNPNGDAP